jgi:hypothetical protein
VPGVTEVLSALQPVHVEPSVEYSIPVVVPVMVPFPPDVVGAEPFTLGADWLCFAVHCAVKVTFHVGV